MNTTTHLLRLRLALLRTATWTLDHLLAIALAGGFLAAILAANYVTSRYGTAPVGFGLTATAGTYFAGLTFLLRDALQDEAGKLWTLSVIGAGAALSFAVSLPAIAVASAAAFALAETCDMAVYTPLRRRGYVRAAVLSNVAGTLVDTLVFLWLAAPALERFTPGFSIGAAMPGQVVGKLLVTLATVALVVAYRARRQAVWAR